MISRVYWCELAVAGIVKVAVKEEASMPAGYRKKSVEVRLAVRTR